MNDILEVEDEDKVANKVGMPETLYLKEYGAHLRAAFGHMPYHVGSSLYKGNWRDVDIRILLPDEVYESMGFGDPMFPHENPRWVAYCLAFSELGKRMTGLPIDFQIQQQTKANADFPRTDQRR